MRTLLGTPDPDPRRDIDAWQREVTRLARERIEMHPDPFKSSPKQREAWRAIDYRLRVLLGLVPGEEQQ